MKYTELEYSAWIKTVQDAVEGLLLCLWMGRAGSKKRMKAEMKVIMKQKPNDALQHMLKQEEIYAKRQAFQRVREMIVKRIPVDCEDRQRQLIDLENVIMEYSRE